MNWQEAYRKVRASRTVVITYVCTMLSAIPSRITASFNFAYLLLGILLVLLPFPRAKAQYEPLPPPPPPGTYEFEAPQYPSPQYQNSPRSRDCYRVIVDGRYGLRQVKRVVPDAFALRSGGIQAGYLCGRNRIEARVRELESRGIYGARAVSISNRQDIAYPYSNRPLPPNTRYPLRCGNYSDKYYYVVVPSLEGNLRDLVQNVRRNVRGCVQAKGDPRGEHVRVGPYYRRSEAEEVNISLKNRGFRNARVYYGK